MSAPPPRIQVRGRKPTRAERNDDVRRRLFEAAARIVGEHGYAGASVARITSAAAVAQGTFYTHFANRQQLLDELLPRLGQRMVAFIRDRVDLADTEADQEVSRFRAFFAFLREVPEFPRILNEAEFFAPDGYQRHLDNVAVAYMRLLRRGRKPGGIGDFSDAELEVVVHMLMGARSYLSRRFVRREEGSQPAPEAVLSAYEKLVRHGLFNAGARST